MRDSKLNKKVRELVADSDLPDYKIAAMVEVTPTSIRNIRIGSVNPSAAVAERIYECLTGKKLEL